ncbi:hypothetical protein [Streptomyces panaciradicis]|nr:hypothetical protein [Streptomyces panaciradicis]MCL6673933.1 hypothetical protein [Streptomyces panaciradicis]
MRLAQPTGSLVAAADGRDRVTGTVPASHPGFAEGMGPSTPLSPNSA